MTLLWKNLLFTVLVPGTVSVYVPFLLARGKAITSLPLLLAAGLTLLGVGAATYLWCLWDFASFGRGTPLPIDAPKSLVVRGLYRYARNPMYIGVVTAILGWAALFSAGLLLVYAVLVALVCHLFVIWYEEPRLSALFGAEYAAYCAQVGRWLPRPAKRPAA